jgi:hypothetical protein
MKKFFDFKYVLIFIKIGIIVQTISIIFKNPSYLYSYFETILSLSIIAIMSQISFKIFNLKLFNNKFLISSVIICLNAILYIIIFSLIFNNFNIKDIAISSFFLVLIVASYMYYNYLKYKHANKKLKNKINTLDKN